MEKAYVKKKDVTTRIIVTVLIFVVKNGEYLIISSISHVKLSKIPRSGY